ncbi:class I SAM-dependent methyltransferase [Oryzihumus leptocrescens]|uniref:Methyltransferase family protein n=1 Tax=Oryzihumus leptocrescens TaxID=297536 RepID=A0A542ZEQ0_9MICO|nr:class I SAM-dependent methyltransferase [Oryzihumus leptocrescens]TQL58815.1 methyltransferase family protein [Oryzihumus leptocrescens]
MADELYADPRLVALYDAWNGGRWDVEHYVSLARTLAARRIVDVGCGTGTLAIELAEQADHVTGLDPAAGMLHAARAKPGAEAVTWVQGTAADLPGSAFDLAVMTGHVAQVFVTEVQWAATLGQLSRVLAPGGVLAFETRNPAAQAWRRWTPEGSREEAVIAGRRVESWHEVTEVGEATVSFTTHHLLGADPAEHVESRSTLAFRDLPTLERTLEAAGFSVETVHGDWDGSPLTDASPEIIVSARRV